MYIYYYYIVENIYFFKIYIILFFPGLFLPTRGGYFMSSESGVWEICRYVFHPTDNSVLRHNATHMASMNPFDMSGLKGEYFTSKRFLKYMYFIL